MTQQLSRADKTELFSHQKDNGPFSALAVETAGLNYLDRLNRQRLDPLAPAAVRTKALHRLTALEAKLFHYIQAETPLSYFDADFQKETEQYILMRTLFLKAVDFTFKRHRLAFLLDLLRLYAEDPCNILPERDIMKDKWEHTLLYDYLLLDMGQKNTEDIGREAVSNGYHECDYTLEIEEVWKQPMKAVPRTNFRYVVQSLPYSQAAKAVAVHMKQHVQQLAFNRWVVNTSEIEASMGQPLEDVAAATIAQIEKTYQSF